MKGNNIITIILFILLVALCCSCASAKYEVTLPDGTHKKISYNVAGKRGFENLKINPETGLIEMGKAGGDAGNLAEMGKNLSEVLGRMAGIP